MPTNEIVAKAELDKLIIDEYYLNGFNRFKAVEKYRPEITGPSARTYYTVMAKLKDNRVYIAEKIERLRADTQISGVHVLRELINFSFSDITDYINLSASQLQDLPPDVRRCIHSFERKKVRYLPRGAEKGEEVEEETIKIKLFDKLNALEKINKHIGFYSEDNRQKAANINLTKIDKVTLNALINAIE